MANILLESLLIPPAHDKFIVFLPNALFESEFCDKYNDIIIGHHMHIDNINDLIHATIMGISPPSFSQENIQQTFKISGTTNGGDNDTTQNIFIDQGSIQSLIRSKSLNITFKHIDAYLSYWFFFEAQAFFKNPKNGDGTIGEIMVGFKGSGDKTMVKLILKGCTFGEISNMELSYENFEQSGISFDVSFDFSEFSISIDVPDKIIK